MSTATRRAGTARHPSPAPGNGARPAPVPAIQRRAAGRTALGVALVLVGALAAAWLLAGSSDRAAVLVLARDVPYGQSLTAADLTTAEVLVDPGVRTVPASEMDTVLGQVAATGLAAGSLLAPGQVTAGFPPVAGQALVGLPVQAGHLPAGGLTAGDRVLVVDTPQADADPPAGTPASIPAQVVRVGEADLNGQIVVDVTVDAGSGAALAVRAATGRFVLVLQAAGGGS